MRIETIPCKSRKTAIKQCAWASWCVKVEGGYKCFENYQDYSLFVSRKHNKKHIINMVTIKKQLSNHAAAKLMRQDLTHGYKVA